MVVINPQFLTCQERVTKIKWRMCLIHTNSGSQKLMTKIRRWGLQHTNSGSQELVTKIRRLCLLYELRKSWTHDISRKRGSWVFLLQLTNLPKWKQISSSWLKPKWLYYFFILKVYESETQDFGLEFLTSWVHALASRLTKSLPYILAHLLTNNFH